MRPEVQVFLKFLHQHTETEIRQGVLQRDKVGLEFLTLQKKALQRGGICNSAQKPDNSSVPAVRNN